jgi:DUF1680 family protein
MLELPIAPRWTFPDPRMDAVRGAIAVERGPLVYCVESVDVPAGLDLDRIAVRTTAPPADAAERAVHVAATVAGTTDAPPWPYATERSTVVKAMREPLRMVPYFARANRGPAAMRVFLPEHRTDEADR